MVRCILTSSIRPSEALLTTAQVVNRILTRVDLEHFFDNANGGLSLEVTPIYVIDSKVLDFTWRWLHVLQQGRAVSRARCVLVGRHECLALAELKLEVSVRA